MTTATAERKTELQSADKSTTLAIDFEATKEQLTQLVESSGTLTVESIDDKKGIAACRERRLELKDIRVKIEKKRKELKADSLAFGRKVDDVAKELTAIIEPEEKRLEHEESIVKRHEAKLAEEKAQREKEAQEKRSAMIAERLNALLECGKIYRSEDVADLDDTDFGCLLSAEKAAKAERDEAERQRIAEQDRIAEANRVEAERLAKEKAATAERLGRMQARAQLLVNEGFVHDFTTDQLADMTPEDWEVLIEKARRAKAERDRAAAAEKAKLDKQREVQEAAQAKIDAENKRLADEEAERQRQAIQRSRLDLIANVASSIGDTEVRRKLFDQAGLKKGVDVCELSEDDFEFAVSRLRAVIAEHAESERKKADAHEAELARLESLKPDHEKLLEVEAAILCIVVPDVSEGAQAAADLIGDTLRHAARDVRLICEEMFSKK